MFGRCLYKGHSESQKLNGLVLSLILVDMEIGCTLHVIHMVVTQIKLSGIDGLSRGYFLEGIMIGQNPLDFITLNELDD